MNNQVIHVNGMSCDHCVQTITTALKEIKGVEGVQVDLENKTVAVEYKASQTDLKTISAKIKEVGFEVVEG